MTILINPFTILQTKCKIIADGSWGPQTYNAARKYFKLTNNQAAHFFGQCSHETGEFKVFSENLNYSDKGLNTTFKKYFPTIESTVGYARVPEKIANKVYANRMGNGPESSGDGYKFRGRGSIQLTGHDNYLALSKELNCPNIMKTPEMVATEFAFESAIFFFNKNKLFTICDLGIDVDTITKVSKKVNGGTIGLPDRISKTQLFYSWYKE